MKSLGQRIVDLRDSKGMTQAHLADKLNITPATLSRYENNLRVPNATFIISLSTALEVSSDAILGISQRYNTTALKVRYPQYSDFLDRLDKLNEDNRIRIDERIDTLLQEQDSDK